MTDEFGYDADGKFWVALDETKTLTICDTDDEQTRFEVFDGATKVDEEVGSDEEYGAKFKALFERHI